MKKFKDFLKAKGISEEDLKAKNAEELAVLHSEWMDETVKSFELQVANGATKKDIESAIKEFKSELDKNSVSKTQIEEMQEAIDQIKENGGVFSLESADTQIKTFISQNIDKIKSLHAQKSGVIEFQIKAPGTVTSQSATSPIAAPSQYGTQQAPASNVNLRGADFISLTTNVNTSVSGYTYTETVPKEGDYAFVAEGAIKPQIDFKIETRYATPVKVAAWIKLTDESVQDIVGLQSIATDLLRKKHDLKKQNGILFGDGTSPNPKGATRYGRLFVAGAMALKVVNPNIMDVINAAITDIYNTHNYEDETSYLPSIVVLNPTDFYLQFVSAKDNDGKPLYPTASLFNQVNIGGVTIFPERSIPVGKIFVADMSKYNTTNYIAYNVQIGWVNDDFIKNQFVMLGESRFHAFVRRLDEQAFIYDDIAAISTAIKKV
jgi:hypothetical protein